MTFTEKNLATTHPTTTSQVTAYTSPASTTTIIKSIRVCNVTSSDVTFNIFRVPSGGSAGIGNALYYTITLPAYQTIADDGFLVLEASEFLVVEASAGNSITFSFSGGQIV